MNWQALLTSDMALIAYELIAFLVMLFLILRFRKQTKEMASKQEHDEYMKQRSDLDSMLSNHKGGN